jgi:phosphoglycerol transferase MdoB-like AlkP superfamily enzyme
VITTQECAMEGPSLSLQTSSCRTPGGRPAGGLVPVALCLAAMSLVTKAMLLPFAVASPWDLVRWMLRLVIVTSPDLCFVTGLTAASALALACVARWPRLHAVSRSAVWLLYCACGLYAVASVPMYRITMVPFTLRLIAFAGGPGMMTSSLEQYMPPGTVAAFACVPLVFWAAARWLPRAPWPPFARGFSWKTATAAILGVAAIGTVSRWYIEARWVDPNRWERRLAQSPHSVFLGSCLEELFKEKPFTYSFSFSEIDESDFVPRPAALTAPVGTIPEDARPRNVILVVLESTGAEYLGVYGSRYNTTPKLSALAAAQGIVYENVYAQAPARWKSLLALVASSYCRPDWRLIVRDCPDFSVPTIVEVLRDRGYHNCFLHAGYWDWQGGEEFLKHRGVETLIDARHLPSPPNNSWGTYDRVMFQTALDWIDGHRQDPFFVCACTIETHHPYTPAADPVDFGVDDEEFNRYLNAVRTTDDNLAWLWGELVARGLDESTVLAVTADHGESFGQHNERMHTFGVYEPTIHVPLLLVHQCLVGRPRRDHLVRQHVDLAPTLLDMLGIPAPKEWQGRSLLAKAPERRAYFCAMANKVVLGLRDGPLKYHYYVDTDFEELFDIENDPCETVNLAQRYPERVAAYRRRVGGFVNYQRRFLEDHGGSRVVAAAR